jgi:hypothetical protein
MCFRRQFLPKMWPIQSAFLRFISCSILLPSWLFVTLLHFQHDRSNWSSLTFCTTTFDAGPYGKEKTVGSDKQILGIRYLGAENSQEEVITLWRMTYGCVTEAAVMSALWQMWGTSCGIFQCFAGEKELLWWLPYRVAEVSLRCFVVCNFLFSYFLYESSFHVFHFSKGF